MDKILEIKVVQSGTGAGLKVRWTLWQFLAGGGRSPLGKQKELDLPLPHLRRETIELLARLQRLLNDSLQDRAQLCGAVAELRTQAKALSPLTEAAWNEAINSNVPVQVEGAVPALTKAMGKHLFEALFIDRLNADLINQLQNSESDSLLRIELEFQGDGAEVDLMRGWPWEYLFVPRDPQHEECTGQFLALAARLVMNRWLSFEISEQWTLRSIQRISVLVVVAAPPRATLGPVVANRTLDRIRSLKEQGIIELAELGTVPEDLEDLRLGGGATRDSIPTRQHVAKLVEQAQPHIVHFIGHGQCRNGRGYLAFVDEGGQADWVDDEDFARMVTRSANLKLVFLQACESAMTDPHAPISGLARQLALHKVPAIVAMQAKVANQVADVFAEKFYQSLAEEKPVDFAVKEGREAIRATLKKLSAGAGVEDDRDLTAFGVPVLYLRSYEGLFDKARSLPRPNPVVITGQVGNVVRDWNCPSCQKVFRKTGAPMCKFCGANLDWPCPVCSHAQSPLEEGQKLCDNCYEPLEWRRMGPTVAKPVAKPVGGH